MSRTDRHLNLKSGGITILEECRELDLDSNTFDVTVDTENENAIAKVSDSLIKGFDNNAIAYAVALG